MIDIYHLTLIVYPIEYKASSGSSRWIGWGSYNTLWLLKILFVCNSKFYSIFRHYSWHSMVLHLSVFVCFYAAIHVVFVTVYCGLLYWHLVINSVSLWTSNKEHQFPIDYGKEEAKARYYLYSNNTSDRALYVKAERGCFVCGGRRHYKAECPNNKKPEVGSAAHICSNCTRTTDIDDADCEEEPAF